jgi:broad specificity phosphatase PhoE
MGMPLDLVFVRHGQSEANVLQQAEKDGRVLDLPQDLRDRPDWMQRLTPHGVDQAKAAGAWITENIGDIGDTFEARYYSSFIRARETAAHLGGAALTWRKHSMLHERDWGHYGTTPRNEQAGKFPRTTQLKHDAPLYARLDGGEALADSVTLRVRDFRDTAKRKWDGKRLIAVTHGDTIGVARYVFEDMLPEQWHEVDKDKSQRMGNCAILWYTRTNPNNQDDVRPYIGWRRMIQPDDIPKSPFGGEWQELPDDRFMTSEELLTSVEKVPRLFSDDNSSSVAR